jgi:hypothetical protein
MRRLSLLAALVLMLLAVACGGSANVSFDEASSRVAISSLLDNQVKAYSDNNARAFYLTYTPRAQQACPFDSFLKAFQAKQSLTAGQKLGVSNLSVQFHPGGFQAADASFTINRDNASNGATGTFAVVAGKWLDDDDLC